VPLSSPLAPTLQRRSPRAIGLPASGVAVLLAVDFVVDMARTALNVAGNALATAVVAKSERLVVTESREERRREVAQPVA